MTHPGDPCVYICVYIWIARAYLCRR